MKKNENLAEEKKMATQATAFSAPGVLETFELNMRACGPWEPENGQFRD